MDLGLVVHPDVPIGSVKKLLILVELVLEKRLAESHLNLSLPRMRVLPAIKPHETNDLVNIIHDPLDNDRRLLIPHFLEELREGARALSFEPCEG